MPDEVQTRCVVQLQKSNEFTESHSTMIPTRLRNRRLPVKGLYTQTETIRKKKRKKKEKQRKQKVKSCKKKKDEETEESVLKDGALGKKNNFFKAENFTVKFEPWVVVYIAPSQTKGHG